MNGLLQQNKHAARGFRTSANVVSIAYLRLSKLKHLPAHPFTAAPRNEKVAFHTKRHGATINRQLEAAERPHPRMPRTDATDPWQSRDF